MQIYSYYLYKISVENNEFIHSISSSSSNVLNHCRLNNQLYDIIQINNQAFSILDKKLNKYLTAYENQTLKFDSDIINDAQLFFILPDPEINLINKILNNYKDFNNQTIDSCLAYIENNNLYLKFGSSIIKPTLFPLSSIKYNENNIIYKNQESEAIFYNRDHLVYYCIFGTDEYYECLKISIESLINFGKYTGDILIKCDNPKLIKEFLKKFKNKFIIKKIDESYGIFNRYIFEDEFNHYSRVHYIDADILIINDYSSYLRKIKAADLYVYNETDNKNPKFFIEEKEHWFGFDLLKKFNIDSKPLIYNSGFYIINNFEKCKAFFERILQYRELENDYGDQPFFNLALINSDLDYFELQRGNGLEFTNNKTDFYQNFDQTFIHYNTGVGRVSKLELMLENYNHLLTIK